MAKATTGSVIDPLQSLCFEDLIEIIEVTLATPMTGYPGRPDCLWGMPLLIEGVPGIAKTAILKEIARILQEYLVTLFTAPHPPEDFSGALVPDGKGGATQICVLPQVRELVAIKRGILLLDEINGASPATQGALMSLIHERHIGDMHIPNAIRIIAAQNPEEIATGGCPMYPALSNRFIHISTAGPNAREWTTWLMGSTRSRIQAPLVTIEKTIIEDWPTLYPEAIGLFTGFIERKPGLLHVMPALSDPQSKKAWPSHRTWDFATRVWTTSRILEKGDLIRDAMLEACVGPGAASEFLAYQRDAKIPKPTDVLKGKWTIDTNRIDVAMAAYQGMVAYVRQRPTREEKEEIAPAAWNAIFKLYDAGLSDIIIPSIEGLIQERLGANSGKRPIMDAASKVLVPLHSSGLYQFSTERA